MSLDLHILSWPARFILQLRHRGIHWLSEVQDQRPGQSCTSPKYGLAPPSNLKQENNSLQLEMLLERHRTHCTQSNCLRDIITR